MFCPDCNAEYIELGDVLQYAVITGPSELRVRSARPARIRYFGSRPS